MFKRKLLVTVLAVLCILSFYKDDNSASVNISSAEANHTPLKLSTVLGPWSFSPR